MGKEIEWPDIQFPPVNLYSAPNWPPRYLALESEFVGDLTQQLYDAEDDTKKEKIKSLIRQKRLEFNRLWNMRAKEV